jgi:hypothetical protein
VRGGVIDFDAEAAALAAEREAAGTRRVPVLVGVADQSVDHQDRVHATATGWPADLINTSFSAHASVTTGPGPRSLTTP